MSETAKKVEEQVFVWTWFSFLLGKYQEWDCRVIYNQSVLTLQEKQFNCQMFFPSSNIGESQSLHILTKTWYCPSILF